MSDAWKAAGLLLQPLMTAAWYGYLQRGGVKVARDPEPASPSECYAFDGPANRIGTDSFPAWSAWR